MTAKEPSAAPGDYPARCPDCGATEGLLRVSEERAKFTQRVKALHWNGPVSVRVEAEGEQVYIEEGVRTVAIRCTACKYEGDPLVFALRGAAS